MKSGDSNPTSTNTWATMTRLLSIVFPFVGRWWRTAFSPSLGERQLLNQLILKK